VHEIRYSAPRSVAEAVALLADGGDGARVLGGGTDLLIQLRAGASSARHLVDVKHIPELDVITCDDSEGLRLGAAVPCERLAGDARVRALFPGLAESAALIGSTQIQNRATVAGNLCNGSPAADTTPSLLALGATCVLAGPAGRRELAVADFLVGPGRTALGPGELLVELRIPAPGPGAADCYQRFIPRREMDIAVVGVAAALTVLDGRCTAARVALGAVGPTALLAHDAARVLVGSSLDDATLERAAAAATATARPIDDMRAPADYRRAVTGVLTRRVVAEAARRARGKG